MSEQERSDELEVLEGEITATLETPDLLGDAARFQDLVCRVMGALGLDDGDVADKLPVSRSAVNRWRHGMSVPLPMARKMIYKALRHRVQGARGMATVVPGQGG